MARLYVTQPGTCIRVRQGCLSVETEDHPPVEFKAHQLAGLCVFGRGNFTAAAMEWLLRHSISAALFTANGKLKGLLRPPRASNVATRLAQASTYLDPVARLRRARETVAAKLANAAGTLRRFASNYAQSPVQASAAEIKISLRHLADATTLDSLRGIEGNSTREYFRGLAIMNRSELAFNGRSRRPPRDPVNAVISLGYVLLNTELTHLLDALGLDPYLGYYHEPVCGRAALALDMLEELRHPIGDRFCLRLVNTRRLRAEHFETRTDRNHRKGTFLTGQGLRTFLADYDAWMDRRAGSESLSPREIMRRQAERLADSFRQGRRYEPYVFDA
ncbi:MAG: CRISPR-associated endonuclease Cas1 [Phycisphaerae bacterium]